MTGARKVQAPPRGHRPYIADLALIRQAHHWTQAQLAHAIGVSRRTISSWEQSQTEPAESAMKHIRRLKDDLINIP